MSRDLAASVRARLLNRAKAENADFNQVLVRYALERMLYRLGQSAHADKFLLKGALLFTLWYDLPHRPTRDADLLGFGSSDLSDIEQVFREITALPVDDGIVFDHEGLRVEEIRKDAAYDGVRVQLGAVLSNARVLVQIDIGFGDAVTPAPVDADFPVLLDDLPAPRLRVYPAYTVVSEKLHAMALLGLANSRLKDYFDVLVIFDRENLDTPTLAKAIHATFTRRGTEVPEKMPIGLSEQFSTDASRIAIWKAFVRKNELAELPLLDVVARLREKIAPALVLARQK